MDYVETWKEKEVSATMRLYKEFADQYLEYYNDWKKGVPGSFNKMEDMGYQNKRFYILARNFTPLNHVKPIISLGVNEHFDMLQKKVEKKIGKIIKIESICGNLYKFEGESGNCKIEVVLAGGYNVQRLHTRWIIKK